MKRIVLSIATKLAIMLVPGIKRSLTAKGLKLGGLTSPFRHA